MVHAVGPARPDDRQVVDASARGAAGSRRSRFRSGRTCETSAGWRAAGCCATLRRVATGPKLARQRLAGQPLEVGLGVERLEMARPAVHEEIDHTASPRSEMRAPRRLSGEQMRLIIPQQPVEGEARRSRHQLVAISRVGSWSAFDRELPGAAAWISPWRRIEASLEKYFTRQSSKTPAAGCALPPDRPGRVREWMRTSLPRIYAD